jgi:cob(I)alamin adenosyltransferase
MKIYTKTGDSGSTSLLGGERVDKNHPRIEAYGTIDELNSFIGLLEVYTNHSSSKLFLRSIQNKLFNIGSILACPRDVNYNLPQITISDIEEMENEIDKMDQVLSPLTAFILPGGSIAISHTHVCRTISRRAERRVIEVVRLEHIDSNIIIFLNRLSDYFFVLGRFIACEEKIEEIKWQK